MSLEYKLGSTPLEYSTTARHRVVCGLRWDQLKQEETGQRLSTILSGTKSRDSFDLDLACVMYDEDGNAVDGVSGKPNENIDNSGHVYHSGDETTGASDHDDESISIELNSFPENIHHIVFIAEIQSRHSFSDIENPEIRIADGKTDVTQLHRNLGDTEGQESSAYIFARIYRHAETWMVQYIGEYKNREDVTDWIRELQQYL